MCELSVPLFSEVLSDLWHNRQESPASQEHKDKEEEEEGAACEVYQAIFNSTLSQLPPSSHGASKWLSHSPIWRYAKKKQTGGKPGPLPPQQGIHSSLHVDVVYWVTSILAAWLLERGCGGFEHRQLD